MGLPLYKAVWIPRSTITSRAVPPPQERPRTPDLVFMEPIRESSGSSPRPQLDVTLSAGPQLLDTENDDRDLPSPGDSLRFDESPGSRDGGGIQNDLSPAWDPTSHLYEISAPDHQPTLKPKPGGCRSIFACLSCSYHWTR